MFSEKGISVTFGRLSFFFGEKKMPLPKPRTGEEQNAFVSRCIQFVRGEDKGVSAEQASAMCYTAWRERSEAVRIPMDLKEGGSEVQTFREEMSLEGAEFREENGSRVIHNLVLLGSKSQHGYEYTAGAMRGAVNAGRYEGVRLFLDHSEKNGARSIMQLAGVFRNVRYEAGKIKGDAHLLQDEYGAKVWNIAKTFPTAAGFSHVAAGELKRVGGKAIVEEIQRVLSVDLVTSPATTKHMFESANQRRSTMEYKDIAIADLRSNRPDIVKALVEEGEKSRDAEVKKLTEERDTFEKKVDEFQVKEAAANRKAEVEKLLSESKLPEAAKTDIFRKQLLRMEGTEWKKEAEEAIEDRRKAFSGVKEMGGERKESKSGDAKEVDMGKALAALRG